MQGFFFYFDLFAIFFLFSKFLLLSLTKRNEMKICIYTFYLKIVIETSFIEIFCQKQLVGVVNNNFLIAFCVFSLSFLFGKMFVIHFLLKAECFMVFQRDKHKKPQRILWLNLHNILKSYVFLLNLCFLRSSLKVIYKFMNM